jgi:hypothetical protein
VSLGIHVSRVHGFIARVKALSGNLLFTNPSHKNWGEQNL